MNKGIVLIALLFIAFGCSEGAKDSSEKNEENVKSSENLVEPVREMKKILCFGNSLTAGYGLEKEEAYPEVLQTVLDSLGHDFEVTNAGVSGETTSGGLNRIEWVMKNHCDIFILELGANDGLRGIPTTKTQENLEAIITIVREKAPGVQILLAGMKVPPNMGDDYATDFEAVFPAVAEKMEVTLIPFFLDGVAGMPDLNQADGIHPTKEGVEIVVNNVMKELQTVIERIDS